MGSWCNDALPFGGRSLELRRSRLCNLNCQVIVNWIAQCTSFFSHGKVFEVKWIQPNLPNLIVPHAIFFLLSAKLNWMGCAAHGVCFVGQELRWHFLWFAFGLHVLSIRFPVFSHFEVPLPVLDYAPCRFTYSSKLEIGWSVQDFEWCPWNNGQNCYLLFRLLLMMKTIHTTLGHWEDRTVDRGTWPWPCCICGWQVFALTSAWPCVGVF